MLQKVNTVFVGKKLNIAGATLAAGDIVIINANTGAPMAATTMENTDKIQLGYVKATGATDADANIVKTQVIEKNKVDSKVYSAYAAKSEATSTIDFTNSTFVAGYRYVIRVIYNDLYEHPGQFTHSYEVIAAEGETATTIAVKFANKINAHVGKRVTASSATAKKVILTAIEITPNGFSTAGKEAITPYSQVQMKVVAYYTNPASFFGGKYNQIAGVVITTNDSKPGKGNPYIVRDREQDALAYKGITYRTEWPVIKPELTVDLSKSYDTVVVEFTKNYQSPDNQYVKSTQIASEIYIQNDAATGTKASDLSSAIDEWINPTV